ncbi:hypothetical protein RchiOBHm_Chr7g0177831 [Rosa chinensis]|uniref:Secreted protein n=1 Tax=Rosa chinensis TaxID=74649 RepID=A0A2P6P1N6_ROSCH|nr:hypothetical protein RchiOBHm_Chr7g0177831 [Rosa chinensis]
MGELLGPYAQLSLRLLLSLTTLVTPTSPNSQTLSTTAINWRKIFLHATTHIHVRSSVSLIYLGNDGIAISFKLIHLVIILFSLSELIAV